MAITHAVCWPWGARVESNRRAERAAQKAFSAGAGRVPAARFRGFEFLQRAAQMHRGRAGGGRLPAGGSAR